MPPTTQSLSPFSTGLPVGNARRAGIRGFTLIELLLSITILAVLMVIVTNVIDVVQKTWLRANSKVSEFREARMALDTFSRNLAQACLNVYWQNDSEIVRTDVAGQSITRAKSYQRRSELQFVSGQTPQLIGGGGANDYPGHGVFFQATLGVASLVAGGPVNTDNLVNLLCGRGYFVSWGDDSAFRPTFLNTLKKTDGSFLVRSRFRYRLMEYSPTAEMNRIYDQALRPIVDPLNPNNNHSKQWFQADLASATAQAGTDETADRRAFVRPVADNVICLVISPQVDSRSAPNVSPSSIAPQYEYDSLRLFNPGAPTPPADSQGTQHLLPPSR